MGGVKPRTNWTVLSLNSPLKPPGRSVYVFSDEVPVEHLYVIVHDLAQVLLSEGQVVVHGDFVQEKFVGWNSGQSGAKQPRRGPFVQLGKADQIPDLHFCFSDSIRCGRGQYGTLAYLRRQGCWGPAL